MERGESSTIEKERKNIEIKHFDNFDVVINLSADPQLLENLRQNLVDEESLIKFLNIQPEQFFIKLKTASEDDIVESIHSLPEGEWVEEYRYLDKEMAQRMNSVLNEILLSRKVKEVIKDDAVQEEVRKIGYSKIDFIEPLIGIIDKNKSKKFTVYEKVKAAPAWKDLPRDLERELGDFVRFVKHRLYKAGIESVDLYSKQILEETVGHKKSLHLIDIEAYQDIKR
jgi:hypothetical protein